MSSHRKVAILGAGPSGFSVAWELARRGSSAVTILEAESAAGGLSKTAEREGLRFDAGPHRLSGQLPEILEPVRTLLDNRLRRLPNSHAIFYRGHIYHYPPTPGELLRPSSVEIVALFGSSWLWAMARNAVDRVLGRPRDGHFESILVRQFGRRFCESIIFPLIRKVYGTTDLHPSVASIRFVRAAFSAIGRKLFLKSEEFKDSASYYPYGGFSRIWDALTAHLKERGHTLELGARIEKIEASSLQGPFRVTYSQGGRRKSLDADILVSSIPNTDLLGYLRDTGLVDGLLRLRESFPSRTMRLGIVVVKNFRLPARVVIFPEERYPFNRIAEMNQFDNLGYPEGQTVLMLDVICNRGSELEAMPDEAFDRRILDSALDVGWFREEDVCRTLNMRFPNAYPVISWGRYEAQEAIDWHFANSGVVLSGREASTDYNNAHNAMNRGFLVARYISGEISFDEYLHQAKLIGRLPILDY